MMDVDAAEQTYILVLVGLVYCAVETTLEFERVTYCFYSLTRVMDTTVAQTSLLPTRSTDKSICNVFP